MTKHKFLLLFLFCFFTTVNSQTIKLVVPFSAGGIVDRSARIIEKTLTNRLPYNFNVEYQTGAGGIIAANNVAKNHFKETVLLLHSSAIATNTFNSSSLYDLAQDFVPVAKLGAVPMVLVTNQKSAISTINDLKKFNSPLFYGAGGIGTAMHVAGEILRQNLNKDLTPVFYKGETAAFNDILTNTIPLMIVSASVAASYTNSPEVSILAITGTARNSSFPGVPTFAEHGIRGFSRSPNWIVIMANPGADPAVVTKIKNALADSFNNPQDQEVYRRAGLELNLQPITNVREFLLEEVEKIRPFHSKLKQ
jgi:tripartite-type tricarboxylate transporter receptor subunit TctC